MTEPDKHYIVVGKVAAPYGVKGWVKIHSYTQEVKNILDYAPWFIRPERNTDVSWRSVEVVASKLHGNGLVVQLADSDSRDKAESLKGYEIAADRQQLPEPEEGQFYWIDLMGLEVINLQGINLGTVARLMETGANDVLVVVGDKERLIPYVPGEFVKNVDLGNSTMEVDWDADF